MLLVERHQAALTATLLAICCLGTQSSAQDDSSGGRSVGAARGMNLGSAVEDIDEAGGLTVSFQLAYYGHDDNPGDGNPFLDEDLTVIEPVLIFDQDLTNTFGYTAMISYDRVTSASIDRLSNFEDQSGASGDNYIGLDLGFRHKMSDTLRLGWHVGGSVEYDYTSIGLGGTATIEPDGGDRVFTFGLNGYVDSIDLIRFDGNEDDGTDSRTSVTLSASWWQLLSPTMWGELGVTLANQSGFLATPYNAVVIDDDMFPDGNPALDNNATGSETNEVLPDSRMRYALHGRLRKRIRPGTALEFGGRLYNDDWGITSFTVEPAIYQTVIPDELDLMVRYRYYTQTEADYFDLNLTTEQTFQTQDSDLGEFDTNTLGARLIWYQNENQSFNVGLDFASRSDGLDYIYGSIGWSATY
ncbi:MAG: hypothetical protein ACI8QS_003415 [Planctomycetota bacterium]|jgi:hypothetical protein